MRAKRCDKSIPSIPSNAVMAIPRQQLRRQGPNREARLLPGGGRLARGSCSGSAASFSECSELPSTSILLDATAGLSKSSSDMPFDARLLQPSMLGLPQVSATESGDVPGPLSEKKARPRAQDVLPAAATSALERLPTPELLATSEFLPVTTTVAASDEMDRKPSGDKMSASKAQGSHRFSPRSCAPSSHQGSGTHVGAATLGQPAATSVAGVPAEGCAPPDGDPDVGLQVIVSGEGSTEKAQGGDGRGASTTVTAGSAPPLSQSESFVRKMKNLFSGGKNKEEYQPRDKATSGPFKWLRRLSSRSGKK